MFRVRITELAYNQTKAEGPNVPKDSSSLNLIYQTEGGINQAESCFPVIKRDKSSVAAVRFSL